MNSEQLSGTENDASITKEDERTFAKWMSYLKKPDRPFEGRTAFLKSNAICEPCKGARSDCTLSANNDGGVRCIQCTRQRKQRCPRQETFEIFYIAKKMSKPLGTILLLYEEHRDTCNVTKAAKTTTNRPKPGPKKADLKAEGASKEAVGDRADARSHNIQQERIVIEISDDEDEVGGGSMKAAIPAKVKQETKDEKTESAMDVDTPAGASGSGKETEIGNAAINTLGKLTLQLNRKLAVLRLFFHNALKAYQGDRRLAAIELAMKKLELIAQDFSKTLDLGRKIGVDELETLIGDLAVCRDKLSLAIDLLADDRGAERLRKHRSDLEEIVLGFGAVLEQT